MSSFTSVDSEKVYRTLFLLIIKEGTTELQLRKYIRIPPAVDSHLFLYSWDSGEGEEEDC